MAFADIRQDILNGLDSAQSEGYGWDIEVKAKEVVTAVVRTSNTVVTITLTAQPGYDITAREVITVTVPASALISGGPLTGTPTFTVDPVSGGSPFDDRFRFRPSRLISGTSTRLRWHNSFWPPDAGILDPTRDALADSNSRIF